MTIQVIRDWLVRNTTLEPMLLEGTTFEHIVNARLKNSGFSKVRDYLPYLARTPVECEALITEIAVSESWLFRYPRSFELLAQHLARLHFDGDDSRVLRMLSAACAAGQESCSMAITALHAGWPAEQIMVDALDVNRTSIDVAGRGVYSDSALREDIPTWARARLSSSRGEIHVPAEILKPINYRHGDLLKQEWSGTRYDVIFCRNLLIYMNKTAREFLIQRLADWLSPSGLLFVGHAEQLSVFAELFEPLVAPHCFAMRPATARPTKQQDLKPASRPLLANDSGRRLSATSLRETKLERRKAPRMRDPVGKTALLAAARELADRGRLKEAQRLVEKLLMREGPQAAALELLGTVQLALGHVAEARESFGKAVYLEPGHEGSLLQLALINEQIGRADLAQRYRHRAERAHNNGMESGATSDEQ